MENLKGDYLLHPNPIFSSQAPDIYAHSVIRAKGCAREFKAVAHSEVLAVTSCYESHAEALEQEGLVEIAPAHDGALFSDDLPQGLTACTTSSVERLREVTNDACEFAIATAWKKAALTQISFEEKSQIIDDVASKVYDGYPFPLTWLSLERSRVFTGDTVPKIRTKEVYTESILTEAEIARVEQSIEVVESDSASTLEKDRALDQIYAIYRAHLPDDMIKKITDDLSGEVIGSKEYIALGGYWKLPAGVVYSITEDFYKTSRTFDPNAPYSDLASWLYHYPFIFN